MTRNRPGKSDNKSNLKACMLDFLKYNRATAINSFKAHKYFHGTAARVVLFRVDDLIALESNATAHDLITALAKYNDKCKDMALRVERLVCLEPTSSEEYLIVLADIRKEREELVKRVTEAYKFTPT